MTENSVFILGMSEKRVTMNVEIDASVQDDLRTFCKAAGRIQKEVIAQMIRWFIEQKGIVRRVVLDDVDEDMTEAYAMALERLARQVRTGGVVLVKPKLNPKAGSGEKSTRPRPRHAEAARDDHPDSLNGE